MERRMFTFCRTEQWECLGEAGVWGVGGMSKKIPVCLPLGAKKLPFKDGS